MKKWKKLACQALVFLQWMPLFLLPQHIFAAAANAFLHSSLVHVAPFIYKCPKQGPKGPRGATGAIGPAGQAGARGATGIDAPSVLIPYASGGPVTLVIPLNVSSFSLQYAALLGFGNSVSGINISIFNGILDLTGAPDTLLNFAFSAPANGTITSIAAFFSVTESLFLPLPQTITITAQLFESSTPDNIFTAVPGASVTLAPSFSANVDTGTISNGIVTGLRIPVTAQHRYLLVFTAAITGEEGNEIIGYASGGVSMTMESMTP